MSYNKNEFHQGELSEELDLGEFAETENDEASYEERFIHEDEYNRDAYVGLSERDEFELEEAEAIERISSGLPRRTILQRAMQVLKVRAMTMAVGAAVVTSPAAEKVGLTHPGASKLLRPDGTPVLQQTHQHNFEDGWTETLTATCIQQGQRELICKDCNESVKQITLRRQ